MPRPRRCRRVQSEPPAQRFGPYDQPPAGEVFMPVEGLEALRLADVEGLDQEQAAQRMGVSRQTFGRVLASARQSVAAALAGGMALTVSGGDYVVAGPRRGWRRHGHPHHGGRGGRGPRGNE